MLGVRVKSLLISFLFSLIAIFSVAFAGSGFQPVIKGQWVRSDELKPGMKIITANNEVLVIEQRWTQREQKSTTYNFEVANHHTYFVSKEKLWAHNICIDDINKKHPSVYVSINNGRIDVRLGSDMTEDGIRAVKADIELLSSNGPVAQRNLPVDVHGSTRTTTIYKGGEDLNNIAEKFSRAAELEDDRAFQDLMDTVKGSSRAERESNERIINQVMRNLFGTGKKKPN